MTGLLPQLLSPSYQRAGGLSPGPPSEWRTRGGALRLQGSGRPPLTSALCDRSLAQSLWALFTSSLAISLVFAVIPFCTDVKVLAAVMALAGLAMGCIDTVANMQLVRTYQQDSAVFLQVTHWVGGAGRAPCICPSPPAPQPQGSVFSPESGHGKGLSSG